MEVKKSTRMWRAVGEAKFEDTNCARIYQILSHGRQKKQDVTEDMIKYEHLRNGKSVKRKAILVLRRWIYG